MKSKYPIPIVFILLALLFNSSCDHPPNRLVLPDFNLIWISIDSLRADFAGFNGMPEPMSPYLDRLSQKSCIYTDVLSQASSTFFSHRSLFLSKYVYAQNDRIPEPTETMAGQLKTAGWRTGAFVDGGWMYGHLGHAAGFDVYDESGGGFTNNIIKGLGWVSQDPKQKFFLMLHGYDIHYPYQPPENFKRYFLANKLESRGDPIDFESEQLQPMELDRVNFQGEIRACDAVLSQLFFSLDQIGLLDKTIIAVFSDHGESLGERRYVGHGHLYDVQLRIPLLIHIPGQIEKIFDNPVELVDLMPTSLGLLGITCMMSLQGIDLNPLSKPKSQSAMSRPRLTETKDESFRMDNQWKLIIRNSPDKDELYCPESDPEELQNLIASYPDVAARLMGEFEQFTGLNLQSSRTAGKPIYLSEMVKRKRLMPARGTEKEIADMRKFEEELIQLGYIH